MSAAERRCDGSERVVFEQTYGGIRVDSSSFELVVQAQQVKRVSARFRPVRWARPQVDGEPGMAD